MTKRAAPRPSPEAGGRYGKLTVLGLDSEKAYRAYRVRCECGRKFTAQASVIYRRAETGCGRCTAEARKAEHIAALRSEEIGRAYGELTVHDVVIERCNGQRMAVAHCVCSCGNHAAIPLNRLRSGGARTCGHNTDATLRAGRDQMTRLHVDGTSVAALAQRLSKNSTTGVKGVSRLADGRYRAYIVFRRKQYHLGTYTQLEDAAAARKAAEKEIYGDFLAWYERTIKTAPEG